MTVDTKHAAALKAAALEALKYLSGGKIDPVEVPPIAERIERQFYNVGPFTIGDLYDVLHEAATEGLTRYVEVARYSGFAMTEKGFEEA